MNSWDQFVQTTLDTAVGRGSPRITPEAASEGMRTLFPASYDDHALADAAKAIADTVRGTGGYSLVDVESSDTLPQDAIEALITGQNLWDAADMDGIDEWVSGQQWDAALWHVDETLSDLGYDADLMANGADVRNSLSETIRDHDTSDPYAQIVSNTDTQVCEQILIPATDMPTVGLHDHYRLRAEGILVLADAMDVLPLSLLDRWRVARSLFYHNTCDYPLNSGVTLGLLFQADLSEFWKDGVPLALTHTGEVTVALIDHNNGSGHAVDVKLPAGSSATLNVSEMFPIILDGSYGYGWDDITGGLYADNFPKPEHVPHPTPVPEASAV